MTIFPRVTNCPGHSPGTIARIQVNRLDDCIAGCYNAHIRPARHAGRTPWQ